MITQLREATPFSEKPRFLIRDNDSKYAAKFASVAVSSGIEVLRTPCKAARANAFCERFVGSVRRECTDHILILGEKHLYRVIEEYVAYYNRSRPHQGIGQAMPDIQADPAAQIPPSSGGGEIISLPVLGGLYHEYRMQRDVGNAERCLRRGG